MRDRIRKLLFFTTSNVSSVVQYGGIGALEGSQDVVEQYRVELEARRDLFYAGRRIAAAASSAGRPPAGAFYAFLKFDPDWKARRAKAPDIARRRASGQASRPRRGQLTEYLIAEGRIGCMPGVDFGPGGEGYVRFCFARDRAELEGALESLRALFGLTALVAVRRSQLLDLY